MIKVYIFDKSNRVWRFNVAKRSLNVSNPRRIWRAALKQMQSIKICLIVGGEQQTWQGCLMQCKTFTRRCNNTPNKANGSALKLEKYVGPVPSHYAAVCLQLRHFNLNPDLWPFELKKMTWEHSHQFWIFYALFFASQQTVRDRQTDRRANVWWRRGRRAGAISLTSLNFTLLEHFFRTMFFPKKLVVNNYFGEI